MLFCLVFIIFGTMAKWYNKLLLLLIFAICASKNIIIQKLTGSVVAPDLPFSVIVGASFASLSFLYYIGFFGIVWGIVILNHILHGKKLFTPLNRLPHTIILVAAFSVSGYATLNALKAPSIANYVIFHPLVPVNAKPLRMVAISDAHIGSGIPAHKVQEIVSLINAQKPDVIFLVGDIIDGLPERIQPELKILQQMHAPLGIYMVNGNHEYYTDTVAWAPVWEKLGFKLLNNEQQRVCKEDTCIRIAGLTDRQGLKDTQPKEAPDLQKALGSWDRFQEPLVLLSHRPERFDEYAKEGIALMISGHTHGGMVPGLNELTYLHNNGYVSGLYWQDDSKLIVGNGTVGWGGLLARINCPAQILVIDLKHGRVDRGL